MSEAQRKNLGLLEIEKYLRKNGNSLANFKKSMPQPDDIEEYTDTNHLILDELNYDCDKLAKEHERLLSTITDEQKHIYDSVMDAVNANAGGMFFVYGYGGTGKTFLWNVLGAAIRSRGQIVLNVASSGIVALLLQGGRTAHSRFGIPMAVNESTYCSISAGSHQAELLERASLIIWNEAPMMSRHCFETLDRTMRHILRCDKIFGGKVVVLGGDFRQILPVIPGGSKIETVMASLNSSPLWLECKVMELTTNMRLLCGSGGVENQEMADFAKWILDIGDAQEYLSSDSIDTSYTSKNDDMVYTQEYLNSIRISGLPNHCLKLKIGAPIMLLRNIDPRGGLCN
ncbi:uncharacterized protein LOC112085317 [Eutrema salsugineum]|uniref:uncharacterized protein LOC112085317 n=1 Tax=Eutrema salsugineum TaxID=72664 RepID=UPI000CED531F|nr:uncharacterized protein LOC112085317 [Eutrema salsugineum]